MTLTDLPLRDLLDRFASSDPTPGGGSAAALSASLGASLLSMVAALPKTRTGADDERTALAEARTVLETLRGDLARAIDRDTAAYDEVVGAFRLPKATADEQAARKAAIQQALRAATEVPLGVMRLSTQALEQAVIVASHGYKSASSDVGVAVGLLSAGAAGAQLNVDVNLDAIADSAYRDHVGAEARTLAEITATLASRAHAALR
jgi:methenyltetrahydrofolate cyclohydrolase